VSPSFFETLQVRVTRGRSFEEADATTASTAVIVSENVVKRFWPGADPIGKRLKLGTPTSSNPWLTIVGTVAETRYRALPNNPTADPDLYLPALDRSPQALLIRTAVDPASVTQAVREAVRRGQPSVVVFGETTLQALVDAQSSPSKFTTWILGLFATAALLLSVVGIYGVMSYLVAQRSHEFGIRIALGASRGDVVGAVLRPGIVLIGVGTVVGVAITAGLYRLFSSLLYGVTALDVSSGVAILVLVGSAILACLVPAIRATRVDPLTALRNQ
jgi:hypothetical protein